MCACGRYPPVHTRFVSSCRFFYDGQLLNGGGITAASKGAAFHQRLPFKPFVVWDCREGREGRERGSARAGTAGAARAGGSLCNAAEAQLAASLVHGEWRDWHNGTANWPTVWAGQGVGNTQVKHTSPGQVTTCWRQHASGVLRADEGVHELFAVKRRRVQTGPHCRRCACGCISGLLYTPKRSSRLLIHQKVCSAAHGGSLQML